MEDIGGIRQSRGWVDIHAHILPYTDDGASDWAETKEMLCMARRQGISHIIATPHYRPGQDTGKLRAMTERLQETADTVSEGITISLGQEILYFEELPLFLEQGKALTLSGSRYVLVEFRPGASYLRLFRAVRCLVQACFLPVIAHAERYECLIEKGKTEELARCGAYLQVNAASLKGGILDRRAAWCRREILGGNIHFLATDMHGALKRPPETEGAAAWLKKQNKRQQGGDGQGMAERLFRLNQEHILRDSVL